MKNLEMKWRCGDLVRARDAALSMGACEHGTLDQVDTFFGASQARLKIRHCNGSTELISYRRDNCSTPRESEYFVIPIPDYCGMVHALEFALGIQICIRKRRRLLLYGHTRIHLDEVEGLGSFVELETVFQGQTESEARIEFDSVVRAIGLSECEVVPIAYADLVPET